MNYVYNTGFHLKKLNAYLKANKNRVMNMEYEKGKISVLMGIYNCASTLVEALDTIINQTYQNWELILCDDGSKDNTYNIAKSYAEKYPNKVILIKNNQNCGLNHTLNRCLEIATGEYIARMDGDDISLPDRFQKEINILENHPEYDIVSTPMIYFDETGEWGQNHLKEIPQQKELLHRAPHSHAPCIIRHKALSSVGGYTEDKRLLRVEDYDLWVKLYAAGYRGYNILEPLYKMRDDRNAYARRSLKNRFHEVYARTLCIKRLNLPKHNYIYVVRPIIVGLLPKFIYDILHKGRLRVNR